MGDVTGLSEHVQIKMAQDFTTKDDAGAPNVRFIRVEVTNIEPAVESIIKIVADTSWISTLVDELTKKSFMARARPTIEQLSKDLADAIDSKSTESIGEYVVSIVAHNIIATAYSYKALPLAEIIKEAKSGNPGFDYHLEKDGLLLIFGEAKYVAARNAYGRALKQIVKHIQLEKDIKEAVDLGNFMSDNAKKNLEKGNKGFSAAFSTSSKAFDSETLIANVKNNVHFKKLLEHEELIIVAVDIND